MQTETHDHLLQALHGEAFAFARYMLYAEAARRNGSSTSLRKRN
jgi:rubrerythrin